MTLTFDDGWRSIYENAFRILKRADLKATHYIISGYLDDRQFPQYMNIDQVRALSNAGHEIGCHTAAHKHLPKEPDSIIESEVMLSRDFLLEQGLSIETFAYPYGEFDPLVVSAVKNAGFLGARSVERGFNDSLTDRFLLRCQAVKVNTAVPEVIEWVELARKQGVWLILMFHQIDSEGREWSATPKTLEHIVDYLVRNQVSTTTVQEGIQALSRE